MKLEPVDQIPEKRSYHNLQKLIEDFVNSPYEAARVNFTKDDYRSATHTCSSLGGAIKRSGYKIKAFKRGDEVYLAK